MTDTNAPRALVKILEGILLPPIRGDDSYIATAASPLVLGDAVNRCFGGLNPEQLIDAIDLKHIVEIAMLVDCIQDGSPHFSGPIDNVDLLSAVFPDFASPLRGRIEFASALATLNDARRSEYEQSLAILYDDPPLVKTPEYSQFAELRVAVAANKLALVSLRRISDPPAEVLDEITDLEVTIAAQQSLLESLEQQHEFHHAEQIKRDIEAELGKIPDAVAKALELLRGELFNVTEPTTNETAIVSDFFPSIVQEEAWTKIHISKDQIQAAGATSGDAPRTTLLSGVPDAGIESISLEVQLLMVQRPWFWSGLFDNRQWRWRNPATPVVSHGPEQPGGLIPAFVAGVVLARNVIIHGAKPPAVPESAINAILPRLARSVVAPATIRSRLTRVNAARLRPSVRPVSDPRLSVTSAAIFASRDRGLTRLPGNISIRPGLTLPNEPALTPILRRIPLAERLHMSRRLRTTLMRGIAPAITGTVADEAGSPVASARVEFGGSGGGAAWRVKTDANGKFTIKPAPDTSGDLVIMKGGFLDSTTRGVRAGGINMRIRLRRPSSHKWPLVVRLNQVMGGAAEPFRGRAFVRVTGKRNAVQQSAVVQYEGEAHFTLPRGDYTITVTCSEATQITPSESQLTINSAATVQFGIVSNVKVSKPDACILGYVCRLVPKSPDPEEGLFP